MYRCQWVPRQLPATVYLPDASCAHRWRPPNGASSSRLSCPEPADVNPLSAHLLPKKEKRKKEPRKTISGLNCFFRLIFFFFWKKRRDSPLDFLMDNSWDWCFSVFFFLVNCSSVELEMVDADAISSRWLLVRLRNPAELMSVRNPAMPLLVRPKR